MRVISVEEAITANEEPETLHAVADWNEAQVKYARQFENGEVAAARHREQARLLRDVANAISSHRQQGGVS